MECRGTEGQAVTWRRRLAAVHDVECPRAGVEITGGRGGVITLLPAPRLSYEETVLGVNRWRVRSLMRGAGELESRRFERPVFGSFPARGLLVLLDRPAERPALVALAAALQPLLTVHLGIEADVLEPVPVHGLEVRGRKVHGLALVELFPGGLGLLEALHDADRILLDLFLRARAWLAACPCGDDAGCVRCLRSPASTASSGDVRPRRSDALGLLETLGGTP
ncbi:MAG: DUF1998 domain-containing protein [Holophagales bacterium]|nr:DUF1998 domain-containing protein [Holophagales bacterium]